MKDIDVERRLLTVQPEGAKNVHRIRPIPLNEEAFKAVRLAMSSSKATGRDKPGPLSVPI